MDRKSKANTAKTAVPSSSSTRFMQPMPYQEDRLNVFQAPIESLGNREIPAHHFDS